MTIQYIMERLIYGERISTLVCNMYEFLLSISILIFGLSIVVLLAALLSEMRDPKRRRIRPVVHEDITPTPPRPVDSSIEKRKMSRTQSRSGPGEGRGGHIEETALPVTQGVRIQGTTLPSPARDITRYESEVPHEIVDEDVVSTPAEIETVRSLERRASLIYWPRMCLEEEFDLIVSLHTPTTVIMGVEGSAVHSSEATYKLPQGSTVRIIPVCSGCNISPAYRDVTAIASETENRAEFKVLPLRRGEYDLTVEFQLVRGESKLEKIGIEKTTVCIQSKPIHLQLGPLNISVTRRFPRLISMCGSVFSLASFVAARIGIDLQQSLVTLAAGISGSLAGIVTVTIALLLVAKGIRPFMEEIEFSIGT